MKIRSVIKRPTGSTRYYDWTYRYYKWTNESTDEYYEWKNEYY